MAGLLEDLYHAVRRARNIILLANEVAELGANAEQGQHPIRDPQRFHLFRLAASIDGHVNNSGIRATVVNGCLVPVLRNTSILRQRSPMKVPTREIAAPQLRKTKGLTQEAMAELLGVSQAEVSKMERRSELYVGT